MATTVQAAPRRSAKLHLGEFAKYHGLGNDYIVVDARSFGASLTSRRVRNLCDRHTGIGSDGLLALTRSRRGNFGVRIFNPDGSEAENSGNGVRILARCLYDLGYTRRHSFTIETSAGVVPVELLFRGRHIDRIRVEMGRATFNSTEIPMAGPERQVVNEGIEVNGKEIRVTCVSLGNPHCVIFVPRLVMEELHRLGPLLEQHSAFPRRTNVQLARVRSRKRIEALIWERGTGETLASGTSSTAIAAAAFRNGLVGRNVEVAMRGGDLEVAIGEDFQACLTGSATPVFRGRLL